MLKTFDAILLAGGKGTRMRRLSQYLPKGLLPIYDEPLISKQLQILDKYGVNRIIISFHPGYTDILKNKVIVPLGLKSKIFIEPDFIQAGAVSAFLHLVMKYKIKNGLLILGDIYCQEKNDYLCGIEKKYFNQHLFALQVQQAARDKIVQGCNVKFSKNKNLVYIQEKPLISEIQSEWAWTGIAYFPEILLKIILHDSSKLFTHLKYTGDIFSFFLAQKKIIKCKLTNKIIMNLNNPNDLLTASLIEKKTINLIRQGKYR